MPCQGLLAGHVWNRPARLPSSSTVANPVELLRRPCPSVEFFSFSYTCAVPSCAPVYGYVLCSQCPDWRQQQRCKQRLLPKWHLHNSCKSSYHASQLLRAKHTSFSCKACSKIALYCFVLCYVEGLPCPALPCPALPCPALPCPLMCFVHGDDEVWLIWVDGYLPCL